MDDFLEFVNEFLDDEVIRVPRRYIQNMENILKYLMMISFLDDTGFQKMLF